MSNYRYNNQNTQISVDKKSKNKKYDASDYIVVSKVNQEDTDNTNINEYNTGKQKQYIDNIKDVIESKNKIIERINNINKHLKRNIRDYDPYIENYDNISIDHKHITTGAEYPSLKDQEEREIWKLLQQNANCYAYAMGYKDPNTYFPQPGFFGVKDMNAYHSLSREFTCSNYTSRLLLDNPHIYPVAHNKPCDKGYYKVAFTVAPNRDYHLYRQNDDGTYSHKPGSTPARMTDSSNRQIRNPQNADRFNPPDQVVLSEPSLNYITLCNSFCVPNRKTFPTYID